MLEGNMLSFKLFLIIGAYFGPTTTLFGATAKNANLKLLPAGTITYNDDDKNEEETFEKFLKYISQEQNCTTNVILTNWAMINQKDYCINLKYYMDYEQQQQQQQQQRNRQTDNLVPVILLQSQQQDYILHDKFNSDFLTVICIPPISYHSSYQRQATQNNLLSALSNITWHIRQNRVIFRLDFSSPHKRENLKTVAIILKYCNMKQIINAVVISYKFPHNDLDYYSFTKFPQFRIRKHRWIIGETRLFPNQLLDVKGYTLRTLPDQAAPRSMVYYDRNGKLEMSGFMGNFIKYFARSINASWKFAYKVKVGEVVFNTHMLNLTRNHTIDLAASLMSPTNGANLAEYSYPLAISSVCNMLPLEVEITPAEIFLSAMNPFFIVSLILLCLCFTGLLLVGLKRISGPVYRFYWIDLLLNDKAFRGILGQGFAFKNRTLDFFVTYVFVLLFITGLVVVTVYGVYLGSYMTSPPMRPLIKNMDDLDKSSTKLLMGQDYYVLNTSRYSQYHNLLEIVPTSEFYKQRERLNTSYAYGVNAFDWHTVAIQQKRFSRPLFRYSEDICSSPYMHLCLILPLHSVFREPLHIATLNVYASGLFYYWQDLGFYELVSLGRKSFADLSKPREVEGISVSDLKIAFIAFCFALMCSVGIFLIEVFVSLLGKCKHSIGSKI